MAGALILIGLIGGALLIFFLEDLIARLTPRYDIVVVTAQAPGITDGSAVWIGGNEVGTVRRVAFLPSGADTTARLALTLQLPRRLQPQVREDSRVRLTSARLIGAPVVDIVPGTRAAAMLEAGDTLYQEQPVTVAQLTARAAAVRADLDTILMEVRTLAGPARTKLELTQRAFANMESVMAEVGAIRSDLAANPGLALLRDPAFAAALSRVRGHAGELPTLLEGLRDRAEVVGEVAAALQRLQERADSLSSRLDAAALVVGDANSSLSRFRSDTALSRALNAARMELDSLLAEVRRNPLRFVF